MKTEIKNRLFLKKVGDSYLLLRIKDGVLTIEGDSKFNIRGIEPFYKLSTSNCEAIANGYDLDELAEECISELFFEVKALHKELFRKGFQKALELLGNKKFSEEEMFSFVEYCLDNNDCFEIPSEGLFKKWKSLQQNEWDVEIIQVPYHDGTFVNDGETHVLSTRPLLDENGRLVLKRKQ